MGPVLKVKRMKKSISSKSNAVAKLKKKWEKPKKLISAQPGVLKIKNVKKRSFDPIKANRGVILLQNIPHGFYEEEMRKYFGQFGLVTRVRLARSERSGRSKGYAYIEFKVPEVAQIAADTMNNYIMFKHVLKTAYIPPEKQTFNFFCKDVTFTTDANGVRSYSSAKTKSIEKEIENINRVPTDEEHAKRLKRTEKTLQKQQKKYGIDLSNIVVSGVYSSSSDTEPTINVEPTESKKKGKAAKKIVEKQPETNRKDNKIVATKKDKKKVESDASSSDGKSLLGELLNKTYDTDTSDDDFKIDHSFSASAEDSDDSMELMDLLAPKLDAAFDSSIMETSSASGSEDEDSVDDEDSDDDEPEILIKPLKEKKKFENGVTSNGAVNAKGKAGLKRKIKESSESMFTSSQSELDPVPKKKKQNKKKEIVSNSEISASELEAFKATLKKNKQKNEVSTTTATTSPEAKFLKPQMKQKKLPKVSDVKRTLISTTTDSSEPQTVNKKLKKKKGKKALNGKKILNSSVTETTASETEIPKQLIKNKKLKLIAGGEIVSNSTAQSANVKATNEKQSLNNVKKIDSKKATVASPENSKQKTKNKKRKNQLATTTSSESEAPKKLQKTVTEPVPVIKDMKTKKPKPVTSSLISENGNAKKSKKSKIKLNVAKPTTTTGGDTSAAWNTVSETDGENPKAKGNSNLKTIVRKNISKKKGEKGAKVLDVKKVKQTPDDLLQILSAKVFKQNNQLKSKKKSK